MKPIAALVGCGLLLSTTPAWTQDDLIARAHDIHARIIALDAHVSFSPELATARYDFNGQPGLRRQITLPAMIQGGLSGAAFSITLQQGPGDTTSETRIIADTSLRLSQANIFFNVTWAERIGIATTAAEANVLHAAGKKIALLNIENGYALGGHAEMLDAYADFGVRFFTPLYAGRNRIGDAEPFGPAADKAIPDDGLTAFGRKVVKRANQLGIVLDVTHARERTALDMIDASKAPVIASHSAMKGVHSHPQNVSDSVAKALAKKGGVVAVIGGWFALRPVAPEKTKGFEDLRTEFGFNDSAALAAAPSEKLAEYDRRRAKIEAAYPKAGVTDLVDHIDYAVRLIGVDHVGLSSDFNGGGGLRDWPDVSQSFNITVELLRRGYSERDIAKIWGENLMRVMEQAERAARNR